MIHLGLIILLFFMVVSRISSSDISRLNERASLVHSSSSISEKFSFSNTLVSMSDETTSSKGKPTLSIGVLGLISANAKQVVKLVWYYFLLYFFTVVYNVANKKVLESFPLPLTVATTQIFMGLPIFLPLWLLKPPKNLGRLDWKKYWKIAACHGFGNAATVLALGSGSVSFVHVVKAAEPLFSAALSVIFMNSKLSIAAYLSLLPIVAGVALASMKELSFTWIGFTAAMLSNLLYQSRMVFSKATLSSGSSNNSGSPSAMVQEPLSAVTTFRVITLVALAELLPLCVLFEYRSLQKVLADLALRPKEMHFVFVNLLISGLSFYIYNEVSFWILDLVHPVTHAVGNTVKRIVLIMASILIFQTSVSSVGLLGSVIAIAGSFFYALAQQQRPTTVTSPSVDLKIGVNSGTGLKNGALNDVSNSVASELQRDEETASLLVHEYNEHNVDHD